MSQREVRCQEGQQVRQLRGDVRCKCAGGRGLGGVRCEQAPRGDAEPVWWSGVAVAEEERRLFYVAVTRACDQLYLLHPMFRPGGRGYSDDYYQSPSDFITELPSELMEEWDIGTVW